MQSTIELNTGICKDVQEVRRDLTDLAVQLQPTLDDLGCALISAGTHPTATWPGQAISNKKRYRELVEKVQWPAQRLMIFGLHVHVGIDSGEKAIAIFNALCSYIPQFLALSASSPFWQGNDTGLASVRVKVFETLPTAGLPYRMTNWGEFQNFMNTLVSADAISSVREVWWDIRPHPGFGTVELRMCDGMPTMSELISLVALIHSTTVWLSDMYDEGHLIPPQRHWIIRENKWRASRWSLDAEIITGSEGEKQTIADNMEDLLEIVAPVSEKLNCRKELEGVRDIMNLGPSYLRQRNIYEQTGKFEPVVDALIEEWITDQRVYSA